MWVLLMYVNQAARARAPRGVLILPGALSADQLLYQEQVLCDDCMTDLR